MKMLLIVLTGLMLCSCTMHPSDPLPAPKPTRSLPMRPHDITVDELDPCAALTLPQLIELGVGGPEPYMSPTDSSRRTCHWRHSPREPIESYLVEHILDFEPERLAHNPLGANIIAVAGFPAIETKSIGAIPDKTCQIFIDLSPNQGTQVAYSYNGTKVPMSRELACQKARTAAEFAMQTLIRQAGG